MVESLSQTYRWHQRMGRWVDPLPRMLRLGIKRTILGMAGSLLRSQTRWQAHRRIGWSSAWRLSRQQLALYSITIGAAGSRSIADPVGTWEEYSATLLRVCPQQTGLSWMTVREARLWPQLDCKGRAVLLARAAFELGLTARLCIGFHPGDNTAHAWVEIEVDNTWWVGDGLSEVLQSEAHYLETSGFHVLQRYPIARSLGVPPSV